MLCPPDQFRLSRFWDIFIPFSIATIPAFTFAFLGIVAALFDQPGAVPPRLLMITLAGLQVTGMIAMAVVLLARFEFCKQQLSFRTCGCPAAWRKRTLVLSFAFMIVFDILANFAAIPGCGPLLAFAVPVFLIYLACIRIAFAKLQTDEELTK
ncbi:hypothetical protein SAMN06265222_1078 [Neorhodopirellula lusitana]|uniref:Uncharacterized protein n=2 Tax=Neorhodopirellula lusitana TaxID=445327 RepID=A0ABY1Q5Y0_9BACT|nr:hypothetical protein SAMN06265222_1078 [Neorhodopirellula lusitana]